MPLSGIVLERYQIDNRKDAVVLTRRGTILPSNSGVVRWCLQLFRIEHEERFGDKSWIDKEDQAKQKVILWDEIEIDFKDRSKLGVTK